MSANTFEIIRFDLSASERDIFETASGACLYVAEGTLSGLTPGAVTLQLDEDEEIPIFVGMFLRVRKFDRIRLINKTGGSIKGTIFISSDPDFLVLGFSGGL